MSESDPKAQCGACTSCRTIFVFDQSDIFSGETFCPVCVSRLESKNTYKKVSAAKKVNQDFRILA